jgi:hypothetical protein
VKSMNIATGGINIQATPKKKPDAKPLKTPAR